MKLRGFFLPWLYGMSLGLGFVATCAVFQSCYAHVSTPSCAQDPGQPGCYPPLHDERAPDAGR